MEGTFPSSTATHSLAGLTAESELGRDARIRGLDVGDTLDRLSRQLDDHLLGDMDAALKARPWGSAHILDVLLSLIHSKPSPFGQAVRSISSPHPGQMSLSSSLPSS